MYLTYYCHSDRKSERFRHRLRWWGPSMIIRGFVTTAALLLAGYAFWGGALGGGHVLNPSGIMCLFLAAAVWFGWDSIRKGFLSARDESNVPIARLDATAIRGLGSLMRRTPPVRQSPSS